MHWFVAPNGEKFYGSGVNGVDAGSPPKRSTDALLITFGIYTPSTDDWAATIRDRLSKWGFNHLGGWNFCVEKIGLPYIANLDLGRLSEALWFDAFDPALPTRVRECADRLTAPHRQLGLRIGYFPDNEIGWWNAALFEWYLPKIGRIIPSGCFGSYFTTATRENGRSCCGTGWHPEALTGLNLFAMPAPR